MTVVEITMLGTSATIPTPTRNHPGIYLRYTGRREYCMLFDAGEGIQRQIFRYGLNFMRLDRIFITHWHADHFAGLLTLIETMSLEGRRDDLYIHAPEADKFVDELVHIGYGIKKFGIIPVNADHEREEVAYDGKEFRVVSFPVKHGVPAVGYRFEEKDRVKVSKELLKKSGMPEKGRIVGELKRRGEVEWKGRIVRLEDVSAVERGKTVSYTGDTVYFPGLEDMLKADIVISECTYLDGDIDMEGRLHLDLSRNVYMHGKIAPKLTVLTHFSRRYESAEFPPLPGGMVYARDGMRVVFGNEILVDG